jgi:hypothetical protein
MGRSYCYWESERRLGPLPGPGATRRTTLWFPASPSSGPILAAIRRNSARVVSDNCPMGKTPARYGACGDRDDQGVTRVAG